MTIDILVVGGCESGIPHKMCLPVYNKLTNLMPDGVTEADVYDVDNNLSVNVFCTLTTLT